MENWTQDAEAFFALFKHSPLASLSEAQLLEQGKVELVRLPPRDPGVVARLLRTHQEDNGALGRSVRAAAQRVVQERGFSLVVTDTFMVGDSVVAVRVKRKVSAAP